MKDIILTCMLAKCLNKHWSSPVLLGKVSRALVARYTLLGNGQGPNTSLNFNLRDNSEENVGVIVDTDCPLDFAPLPVPKRPDFSARGPRGKNHLHAVSKFTSRGCSEASGFIERPWLRFR